MNVDFSVCKYVIARIPPLFKGNRYAQDIETSVVVPQKALEHQNRKVTKVVFCRAEPMQLLIIKIATSPSAFWPQLLH